MEEGEGEGGRREDGRERWRGAALVINQRVTEPYKLLGFWVHGCH